MYNATKAKEAEPQAQLPKDTIFDGIISNIEDGTVKQFVTNLEKWEGSPEQPAINLTIEVKVGEEIRDIQQLFTYRTEYEHTIYTKNSNLGKFKLKYGKLPEKGDEVKVITNSEGYGRIKLD